MDIKEMYAQWNSTSTDSDEVKTAYKALMDHLTAAGLDNKQSMKTEELITHIGAVSEYCGFAAGIKSAIILLLNTL